MIDLIRTKESKWILQKNISSNKLMEAFVEGMNNQSNIINNAYLRDCLRNNNAYRGRSKEGNINTLGVRLSQACFYMFGYKKDSRFLPSPMTEMYLKKEIPKSKISLLNLYSMQFPNPYSKIPKNFKIYIGRLFVKLLLDDRINKKLYIDECIYFLPFLEKMDNDLYEELITSILEYRKLSYEEKYKLFKKVDNYEEVFANCTHEMNYYFLRIFSGFGVFKLVKDEKHNDGKLFSFKHGNSTTYRTDSYESRKRVSGYVILNEEVMEDAKLLNRKFSAFDIPLTQEDDLTKNEWIRELYEFEPLKYIQVIMPKLNYKNEIIKTVKNMIYQSKYGTRDGKSFELSLKPLFEMFRENRSVEIISGAGDTDLLCVMDNEQDDLYKINVDAKTSKTSTSSVNPVRITNHIKLNGSKYCIIVSPRFCKGVKNDINGYKIVTIEAEVLANYCLKECLNSEDGYANFTRLDKLINSNIGQDISKQLDNTINDIYQIK